MRVLYVGVALLLVAGVGAQNSPALAAAVAPDARATVTFTYLREGVGVPQFSLIIGEDGRGRYTGTEVFLHGVKGDPHPIGQDVQLSPDKTAKVFRVARGLNRFNMTCAASMKGIASSGAKTLSYAGPDGTGNCAYDYSENKDVTALSKLFIAMASTMDEGRLLEFDHRFDRLSIDAEMTGLMDRVRDGWAVELENIATVLRSIANDPNVIQRARTKAGDLLETGLKAQQPK